LFEARTLDQFFSVESRVPLGEIEDVEVQRAVGGGVQTGRNVLLIFQLAFDQTIPRGAVGTISASLMLRVVVMAQRPEDALLQKVPIKFASHFPNENAEDHVSGVAVAPLSPGEKSRGKVWKIFKRSASE